MLATVLMISCTVPNELTESRSKVLFYTNAHKVLNCGNFNVNIYVDSAFIGTLSKPVLTITSFEDRTTDSTLLVDLKPKNVNYHAIADCGDYGIWAGNISLKKDSCYTIFLDANDLQPQNSGKVIFYTNAQALMNCGEFDVNVIVDNANTGVLQKPYLPLGEKPLPDSPYSSNAIVLIRPTGKYNYSANGSCSTQCFWSGEFEIKKDSCIFIFLDANLIKK